MKKYLMMLAGVSLMALSACHKESSAYTTYDNGEFTIDYPANWETEINFYPSHPFTAASDNQVVVVATRLLDNEVSLDSFVNERINAFQEQYWGFNLISREVNGNEAIIKYMQIDEESKKGTVMKIVSHDTHFYGVDCSYETESEKDTVEHIINSFQFKN